MENAETDACQQFESVSDLHVDLGLCRLQSVCLFLDQRYILPLIEYSSTGSEERSSTRVLKLVLGPIPSLNMFCNI